MHTSGLALVLLFVCSPAWAEPRQVTLDEVRAAVDDAPVHAAAHERTLAAEADADAAGGWPATSVSIGTGKESPRLVAIASVPVAIFGVGRAARRTARAEAQVTRAEEGTTDLDLRERAMVAWLALYGAGQAAQVTADTSASLDRLVDVTRARRDAGDTSTADVVNAETQAARAHVDADDAAQAVGVASADLAAVVGWDPSEELVASGVLPTEAPALDALGSFDDHPELRVQAARIAAADAAVDEARVANRPTLHVDFEVDAFDPGDAPTDFLINLTIDLPLWGRGKAKVDAARARVTAAAAESDAIRTQLSAELVAAHKRWTAARRHASSVLEQLVPAQARSTELVRKAFAAGEVDLASVIQSERDLLDVRAEALAADLAAAEAWAALERAAGGSL